MRIIVREWQRVLVYRDGKFEVELAPGRHRVPIWRRHRVTVTVRPRLVHVPLQEVLTADGLSVKVSLAASVRVADARTWHEAAEDPDAFLYVALQVALREEVASRTFDDLLADRSELAERLEAATRAAASAVGLVVERLALRDVVVPAEVRRAAAEAATVRLQGVASLERARNEVAATRALANAARMVADNPALLQLRTLQAVEAGGATVVLTAPGAGPLPR
jgi:regulator of protease activity HflC (stomatin/prohibitin superfamily)